mgnify:FL=1
MTSGDSLRQAALLAACLFLPVQVNAQSPQISEGVRAQMFTAKGFRYGPDSARFVLNRQPPIYPYLPEGASHFFATEEELISFFQGFPASVQERGLWITRLLSPDGEEQVDRQRLAQVIREGSRKKLLLYVCDPAQSDASELVAWECRKHSPQKSEEPIFCTPRSQPHLGHPWWDCAIKTPN